MTEFFIHLFSFITLFYYLLSAFYYARWVVSKFGEREPKAVIYLKLGLLTHVSLVVCTFVEEIQAAAGLHVSSPDTLSITSALVVLAFLKLRRNAKLNSLGIIVVPLAIFFLVASGILFHLPKGASSTQHLNVLVTVHVLTTITGHVLLALAFAASVLLIVQERFLKQKRASDVQRKIPALLVLDRLNAELIRLGFTCTLLGVGLGLLSMYRQGIAIRFFDPRLFFSFVTLVVYAVLLIAMQVHGLRGRRAAWLSVLGFLTVVVSVSAVRLFGSSFHLY